MTNLLEETIERLKAVEKTPVDVEWVGNGEYVISWDEFTKIAGVEYDSGYGSQKIANDLLIVGKDWWLERIEYDGSEGWEYKTRPQKQEKTKPFHYVMVDESRGTSCGWESIHNIEHPRLTKGESSES